MNFKILMIFINLEIKKTIYEKKQFINSFFVLYWRIFLIGIDI